MKLTCRRQLYHFDIPRSPVAPFNFILHILPKIQKKTRNTKIYLWEIWKPLKNLIILTPADPRLPRIPKKDIQKSRNTKLNFFGISDIWDCLILIMILACWRQLAHFDIRGTLVAPFIPQKQTETPKKSKKWFFLEIWKARKNLVVLTPADLL